MEDISASLIYGPWLILDALPEVAYLPSSMIRKMGHRENSKEKTLRALDIKRL
jgi:hypothetical protein